MKIAALDLGSNSFLCLICDVAEGKISKVFYDASIITRLGKSVQKEGKLSKESLLRAAEAFRDFKKVIDEHNVEKVIAVTTAAAREASNFKDLKDLGDSYGIPITLISGEEEAQMSFAGAVETSQFQDSLLIDIGGGSTEIAFYENAELKLKSLPIGTVRLGEMFVSDLSTLKKVDLEKMKQHIHKALDVVWGESKLPGRKWVAVAGTPTSLASILNGSYDEAAINGFSLSLDKITELKERLISTDLIERRKIPGLEPKRADVIPVGALILETIVAWAQQTKVSVSTRGLRYGLAIKNA